MSAKADVFVIPTEPPIASSRMVLKGSSDLLGGEISLTDMHMLHLNMDGSANRSSNGVGVFAGPGGDAIYVNWDGAGRPSGTPNVVLGIAGFTIKGGRGKFAGATGSGVFNSTVNVMTLDVNQTWEGQIFLPKK